jgi:hypothetical protein
MTWLTLTLLFLASPPEIRLAMASDRWEPLTFGTGYAPTRYTLIPEDGRAVMQAESQASASGLVRRVSIDPKQHPVIEWSWKIRQVLEKGDATKRSGDDYPARIYITFEVDPSASLADRMTHRAAQTLFGDVPYRAINYIWANQLPKGRHVPNPYTSSVCMIAVQSGNSLSGTWQSESRNVREDYRMCFGAEPPLINGIAIMTDSDNTKGSAEAWYGDVVVRER